MADYDLVELARRPAVFTPAILAVAYVLYRLFLQPSRLPDLPVLNARKGEWFSYWRAMWRNTKDFKAACVLARTQYRDQPCIVPVLGVRPMILLPAKNTKFVIDNPEHVLSLHESAMDNLQSDYTMGERLIREPVHHPLIVTTLTNQTGNLIPELAEETEHSLDELWGSDTAEWREVCVYTSLQRSIGRVTNRIFVGKPVCRDPELLRQGIAFAIDVPLGSQLLRLFPEFVRPLAAAVLMIPNRLHQRAFFKVLRPTIEQRLREYDERHRDPEKNKALGPEPNDFLQWLVNQAKEMGDPYHMKPSTLALRVQVLNFASIHTSSFAITGAVLDLVASRPGVMDELRDEIRTVLAAHGGKWNKRALAQMEKLDSTFRESQRVNSFVTMGLGRRVVARDGVTTPEGLHIPRGNQVCVPGYAMHHDPEIYEAPDEFHPFRFSDMRKQPAENGDAAAAAGDKEAAQASYLSRARKQWATTTTDFLGFGHGRGACPGRFFAAAELKLMLAHLILHYDFEMLDKRPRNMWFALNRVPPMEQTIRVKRRAAA
ncbi:putative ent-kaurene oxidase [Diaporthe ampelina]|uniref:Putative ent-kaurene oxidase n=1 Tax=Diaporthe ampelina TaxID=1214573 RepID=A0A0G2FR82_9PEZI|nr:putative ent-kaurene oxidase [Diaporthe ampelina]